VLLKVSSVKKILFILFSSLFFSLSLAGCGDLLPFDSLTNDDSNPEDADSPDSSEGVEREVSGKLALALGGVAPGTDVIQTEEDLTGRTLDFQTEDEDLIDFAFVDGYNNYRDARGARVVPLDIGISYAIPVVDSSYRESIEVITPPQKLIQILVGEARGQLAREAVLNEEDFVKLTSVSPTGDALGAVIRNRIQLINEKNAPHLFVVNSEKFYKNPPGSSYEAVIEAGSGGNYQFSPLYPDDAAHLTYLDTARRDNIAADDVFTAYDQAVLTAAYIFSDDSQDTTEGAFAFYSPTTSQYDQLQEALISETTVFPTGAGTSDTQYPAMSPIQVLVLPGIATRSSESSVPSFVFVRKRNNNEPAVTNRP